MKLLQHTLKTFNYVLKYIIHFHNLTQFFILCLSVFGTYSANDPYLKMYVVCMHFRRWKLTEKFGTLLAFMNLEVAAIALKTSQKMTIISTHDGQ